MHIKHIIVISYYLLLHLYFVLYFRAKGLSAEECKGAFIKFAEKRNYNTKTATQVMIQKVRPSNELKVCDSSYPHHTVVVLRQ